MLLETLFARLALRYSIQPDNGESAGSVIVRRLKEMSDVEVEQQRIKMPLEGRPC